MADKCPQTTDDYEGGSGAGKAVKTTGHGENKFNEGAGANPHPGENDRFGGKGYDGRLARASKKP